jgi:hypothetical protein
LVTALDRRENVPWNGSGTAALDEAVDLATPEGWLGDFIALSPQAAASTHMVRIMDLISDLR